jgi:hypothetical protein
MKGIRRNMTRNLDIYGAQELGMYVNRKPEDAEHSLLP